MHEILGGLEYISNPPPQNVGGFNPPNPRGVYAHERNYGDGHHISQVSH
jgi:hypothetical protein